MTTALTVAVHPTAHPRRTSLVDADGVDSFCYVRIDLTGRLTILHAPTGGAGLFPLNRRTATGTVERLDAGDGIAVWLDGDEQDAGMHTNWAATHLYRKLANPTPGQTAELCWLHGPALFTGFNGHDPTSLSAGQRDRLTAAHTRRPPLAAL